GDLEEAAKAGIEKIDENKSEQLAARGAFRWDRARQEAARAGNRLAADDDRVKEALDDLKKAVEKDDSNAEARLDLRRALTALGQGGGAKKVYTEGLDKFKDKPEARAFEARLDALELLSPTGAEKMMRGPGPRRGLDEALMMVLIGLHFDDEKKEP